MSDPHVLAPGTAPTPFTADGSSWQRVNRFVAPDDEGATLQRWRIGPDGRRGEGGRATFWFAPGFPGMPVRYETPAEGGGTDRTTMVGNELP